MLAQTTHGVQQTAASTEALQRHITVHEQQKDHTRDGEGNFKHPFLHQPSHIDTIFYPNSKTFSTKLAHVRGPNRHPDVLRKTVEREREMRMGTVDKAIAKVKDWFTGESAAIKNDQTNYFNLLYTGPVYMGSNRERINVVYDTGSSVYLGETHLCTGCAAPKYDF